MQAHLKGFRFSGSSLILLASLAGTVFFAQPALFAQKPATPSPEQPEYKAIWEPINYPEDIKLTSVFFVTPDVGWVTGSAGTILHTRDGGETWEVQLGGDLKSGGPTIGSLRFVDETHGWAVQGDGNLLRTTDGQNWELYGKVGEYYGYYLDYVFTSESVGVQIVKVGNYIAQTKDGGRKWRKVLPACLAKMEIEGLVRDVGCSLKSLHFLSPDVGYAVGVAARRTFLVLKTEDGGATWAVLSVVPDVTHPDASYFWQGVYFRDESTGFVYLSRNEKFFTTTDGGQTWRARIGASPGKGIKFADPEVGGSFSGSALTYTVDGGQRWQRHTFRFPARVNDWSFPRRDRAYIVGDHGMIYRYRIVPADYEVPRMIEAPMMPGLDFALDDQVALLDKQLEALEASLTQAVETAEIPPAAETQEAGEVKVGIEDFGWAEDCCGEQLQPFETTLDAFAAEIPTFTGKYRNLNLVSVGLRLIGQLFGQAQGLKDSFAAFKHARDPQSALAALAEVSAQLQALRETTAAAFQKPASAAPSEPELQ